MKILNALLFIFTVSNCNAQIKSGLIKYSFTINMDEYKMSISKEDNSNDTITPIRYGANKFTIENLLVFKGNEASFFYIASKQKITKQIEKEIQYYQNFNTKLLLGLEQTRGKNYITRDTMTTILWKLSKNTKKIQNIVCFSAQAEYRGRIWTAWYAPSIAVSLGPWKLYGLPGMILEAEDKDHFVHFECKYIDIPPTINFDIETPQSTNKNTEMIDMKQYALFAERDITNFEKMSTDKSGSIAVGIQNIEIFAFEKNLNMKRFQQKLSDTPKK